MKQKEEERRREKGKDNKRRNKSPLTPTQFPVKNTTK